MTTIVVNKAVKNVELTVDKIERRAVMNRIFQAGESAYQIAVNNGFVGTKEEWLDSLEAKTFIRRHDFVANASYCGYAETESLETAPVWNITKILIAVDGSTTKTTATNVKWSDRLTLTYS
jgi:exo-beta-1,3-glucanase (GH17 family)